MRKQLLAIGLTLLTISLFFNYFLKTGYLFSVLVIILIIVGFYNALQKNTQFYAIFQFLDTLDTHLKPFRLKFNNTSLNELQMGNHSQETKAH